MVKYLFFILDELLFLNTITVIALQVQSPGLPFSDPIFRYTYPRMSRSLPNKLIKSHKIKATIKRALNLFDRRS